MRSQAYRAAPGVLTHFRLLGLCAAGRDEGSFQFEMTSLVEQISFYLRLLREASQLGYQAHQLRVTLTDLEQGRREQALIEQVLLFTRELWQARSVAPVRQCRYRWHSTCELSHPIPVRPCQLSLDLAFSP